jgi:hypothetical protein
MNTADSDSVAHNMSGGGDNDATTGRSLRNNDDNDGGSDARRDVVAEQTKMTAVAVDMVMHYEGREVAFVFGGSQHRGGNIFQVGLINRSLTLTPFPFLTVPYQLGSINRILFCRS